MTIEPVSEANFDEKVKQATQPVVVDFWLTLEPRLEAVAQEFLGRVNVYRLDVEKSPAIPPRYDVMSAPTLIFLRMAR